MSRFASAPVPPAAHGFATVQSEQYFSVPFAGVPRFENRVAVMLIVVRAAVPAVLQPIIPLTVVNAIVFAADLQHRHPP